MPKFSQKGMLPSNTLSNQKFILIYVEREHLGGGGEDKNLDASDREEIS